MYLTYEEYIKYGGTLDQTSFNNFEYEAECLINWITFNRLKSDLIISTDVKRCIFKLIDYAKLKAGAFNLGKGADSSEDSNVSISSQSNDGVSVSYNVISAQQIYESCKDEMTELVQRSLQGVTNQLGRKLLYRGLYENE